MKISMTGVSGNMGKEVLSQTIVLDSVEFIRVLLSPKKRNNKLAKKLQKIYKDKIQIVRGSISSKSVCQQLCDNVDYVVHMAAVIPPKSDESFKASESVNLNGTINIVDACKEQEKEPKLIHISTVAIYGNRNLSHPWGRVGDPLIPSPLDCYAMHKVKGELYVLESGLKSFAILRQTAMLYPEMLTSNTSDGLMFHTPILTPLEWVTARDSGLLFKHLFEEESKGNLTDSNFWKHIFNIGGGYKGRECGLDVLNEGFSLIGGTADKFFEPNCLATRNFHGMWFYDSHELEDLFHFQNDDSAEYWKEIGEKSFLIKLGKLVPRGLIKKFLFDKLKKHKNSPTTWVKNNDEARIQAYFGGIEEYKKIPTTWDSIKTFSNGDFGDPKVLKSEKYCEDNNLLLDHGYDESKPLTELTDSEIQKAAEFRGGKLLSHYSGDPFEKLKWECSEGHIFEMSLFSVLKGGHFCPDCYPQPWNFDHLAKKVPFFAQVYYDSHTKDENFIYSMKEDGTATLTTKETTK